MAHREMNWEFLKFIRKKSFENVENFLALSTHLFFHSHCAFFALSNHAKIRISKSHQLRFTKDNSASNNSNALVLNFFLGGEKKSANKLPSRSGKF